MARRSSSGKYIAIGGKRFKTAQAAKKHSDLQLSRNEFLRASYSQAEYDERNGTDNGGDPAIQAWQDMHNHEMNS